MANPTHRDSVYDPTNYASSYSGQMTVRGTLQKTVLLFSIMLATAVWSFNYPNMAVVIGAFIITLGLSITMAFRPMLSPVLAPVHAIAEGALVGAITFFINESIPTKYAGTIPLAVAGTLVTFFVMVTLYVTRIVRVSENFRSIVIGTTAAVAVFYAICGIAWMFAPGAIQSIALFGSGPIGIGFSIVMIGLAAMNYLVDFDFIERGAEQGAPAYLEWYGAFAVLVTTVWLYLEILRLLAKLRR